MSAGVQCAKTQRDATGFALHAEQVEQVRRGVPFVGRFLRILREKVQLDSARAGRRHSAAELQLGLRIVSHPADGLAHQRAEERVHEIQDGLAAAEVVRERDDDAGWRRLQVADTPGLRVAGEDVRAREAEAVDALLEVADEEAVRAGSFTADEAKDGILCGVDILILIHADVCEVRAAMTSNAGRIVAQQAQGELLEVGEVHAAKLALRLGEARGELLR